MSMRSAAEVTEQVMLLAEQIGRTSCEDTDLDGLIGAHQALCWVVGLGEDHGLTPLRYNLPPSKPVPSGMFASFLARVSSDCIEGWPV